jgi:hypothetical protein
VFLIRLALRLILGIVILLVVALLVVDLLARSEAEKLVGNRVKSDTGAQTATVHMGWFPFLYDVALSKVPNVTVHATGVPVGGLRLTAVTVDAHQVELDHHVLWVHQKIQVASISSAQVTIVIDNAGLEAAVHVTGAQVSVSDDRLAVSASGRELLAVNLSSNPLIPDCAFTATPTSDGYRLSCTIAPVPASLLTTLSTNGI